MSTGNILIWTSFLCGRSLIMAAYVNTCVNTFSNSNFSPLRHAVATKNTMTFSIYFMIFPVSTTTNVCSELLLKHLCWYGAYGRKSNIFAASILVSTSFLIRLFLSLTCTLSLLPGSDLTSHLLYFIFYKCIYHCFFLTIHHTFALLYEFYVSNHFNCSYPPPTIFQPFSIHSLTKYIFLISLFSFPVVYFLVNV